MTLKFHDNHYHKKNENFQTAKYVSNSRCSSPGVHSRIELIKNYVARLFLIISTVNCSNTCCFNVMLHAMAYLTT